MTNPEISDYAQVHYGMAWPPDYEIEIPCGWCASCQKSVNTQYRIRLLYEVRRWPPGSCLFVTLTFNEKHLDVFKADYNRAVRLFLDRMRKEFGKQIRHWFIGEFGTLNGRPHYHGILFDVPTALSTSYSVDHPGDHPIIRRLWKYGFVFVGYVNDKTCSYITKYLTKSINGKKVRPRVITSKGLGINYLDTDEARLHHLPGLNYQPFMTLNGFKQAMPRYYYNKIFSDVDRENMVLDKYLNPPPFTWQGRTYNTEAERDAARAATLSSNRVLDLTPSAKPPVRKVVHRTLSDVFKPFVENNEFKI